MASRENGSLLLRHIRLKYASTHTYLFKKLIKKPPLTRDSILLLFTLLILFKVGQERVTFTDFVSTFMDKLGFNRERGRPNVATRRGQDGAVIIALDPVGHLTYVKCI